MLAESIKVSLSLTQYSNQSITNRRQSPWKEFGRRNPNAERACDMKVCEVLLDSWLWKQLLEPGQLELLMHCGPKEQDGVLRRGDVCLHRGMV